MNCRAGRRWKAPAPSSCLKRPAKWGKASTKRCTPCAGFAANCGPVSWTTWGWQPRLNGKQRTSTALFRIFQETLTNVARHAQAMKVWVHLGEEHGAIVLEVEDDGVGISATQLAERRSLGLLGMRERAAAFGGEVDIAGVPAKGTTVIVRMPVDGERL